MQHSWYNSTLFYQQDNVDSQSRPNAHKYHGRHRQRRIPQPIDRLFQIKQLRQGTVNDPVERIIHPAPHKSDGDRTSDDGQESDDLEYVALSGSENHCR